MHFDSKIKRRLIGSCLLVIWAGLMLSALYVEIPTVWNNIYNPGLAFSAPSPDLPSFKADMLGNVTAQGSFSVNNPIILKFVLLTNVTGLTGHYCCLALVDSSRTDVKYIAIQPYSNSSDQYYGSGQIDFPVAGPIYVNFVTLPIPFGNFAQPQNSHVLMTISDVGDTYSWQFQHLTTQLTLVLVAFSVVMLQPVIEAIVGVEKNSETPATQPTPNTQSPQQAQREGQ